MAKQIAPIERLFLKVFKRKMTAAEKRALLSSSSDPRTETRTEKGAHGKLAGKAAKAKAAAAGQTGRS